MDEIDSDALDVMKQVGQEFAEKQVWRWSADDWKMAERMGDEGQKMNAERMAHWKAVKDRIAEICGEKRKQLKEKP